MSSTHQVTLNKVVSLIGALRNYVEVNVATGLLDVTSSVEVLVAHIYETTDKLHLERMNLLKVNFPAIDLADRAKKVAIQVTTNASTEKWKESIRKFEDKGLAEEFDELKVVGFCKAVKPRSAVKGLCVEGPTDMLNKLKSLDTEQLIDLEKRLRESYDFSKLNPQQDKDCFRIVMGVLNRDAIRHYTSVEGSYSDLATALREIRQIITAGTITGKNIYAKPISQYGDVYRDALEFVDLQLGVMLGELARARRGDYYDMRMEQKAKVDQARSSIINHVNTFCADLGFSERVVSIR